MVMNYGIIDTYLHMSNHYKLINSAKSVVNTSPPKSFILKNKKQNASSPSTRYSTPTLLSKNDRLPSRANSHYEFGRRNIKIHNCLQNDGPASRSTSAPSKKYSRKISTTWNSSFLKNKQHFTKNDCKSKTSVNTGNSSIGVSRESSNYSKPEVKHVSYDRPNTSKTPIPTPRKKLPSNKSVIPNYEYLQFSLRITEDIIRNDLYNPEEMQRVFNSHLEANRGRLDTTKMIEQIDHLCKELSITANVSSTESDNKSSELTLRHNSKLLLDKIASRQYEISSEEIRSFSETDLQNIITGILDHENKDIACVTEVPIHFQSNDAFVDLTKFESELIESKEKATTTSDDSTKYFDIINKKPDVHSKEVLCKLDEHENSCTDLIPISLVSENNKTDTPKIENKTILITSDEIETSVKISQNVENKEITIINLEVNQLHNDLLEINKNLTEGFLNLKETIVTENPVKDDITHKATSEIEHKTANEIRKAANEIHKTANEINKTANEIIEEPEEVSIKKNEITQTPFSDEIAHFFDKLPENLSNTEDKNPRKNVLEKKSKGVLHFVGITEKAEIENVAETYEQINIYEPINTKFTISTTNTNTESETSSQNFSVHKVESNFISTINSLILDRMNDLFEPVGSNDIVPNIFTGNYYKYENRNHAEDKYIQDKYKLHRENVHLHKPPITVSQKLSEISLSEGEIVVTSKAKRKDSPNILKVLEKYECKSCDHNNINKYKLNKFELNYDSPMRSVQFFHSSSNSPLTSSKNSRISALNRQESLLSDGEIKYSSDSDDCKTNYSNSSSKV